MATKICPCCGQPFKPRPQVPKQTYCSSPACQRERRQAWQRQKLQDDRFYRENLQDPQRAWRGRNPGYSRSFGGQHKEFFGRLSPVRGDCPVRSIKQQPETSPPKSSFTDRATSAKAQTGACHQLATSVCSIA